MCTLEKRIRDLIHFFVKENYNHHLKINNISTIAEGDIPTIVNELYTEKKDHIQVFVKSSLQVMLKDEMPEEYIINNLLSEIFRAIEQKRLTIEINMHQQKTTTGSIDYNKI